MRAGWTTAALAAGVAAIITIGSAPAAAACIDSLRLGDRSYMRAGPPAKPVRLESRLNGIRRPGCNDYIVVNPDGTTTPANEPDVPVPGYKIARVPSVLAFATSTTVVYAANGFFTDLRAHPLRRALHGGALRRIASSKCRSRPQTTAVVTNPPGPVVRFALRTAGREDFWEHDALLRVRGFRLRGGQPYISAGDRVRIAWDRCPGHPRVLRALAKIAG